jgi:ectoine hydroxylase-related dioxygenase (phytanoyl-CoA dioxygenase family)
MINQEQVDFFEEHGYLRIEKVFTQDETDELCEELDFLLDTWAIENSGWSGPWREAIMDDETNKRSTLIHLHDLQFYGGAFSRGVQKANLVAAMAAILGDNVELHHSTLHLKPPQMGHPFPMHQDMAFYEHETDRYVDVLFHLDDTCHENGEIRFVDGSHKMGYLTHVTEANGEACTPHLPVDEFPLEATVAVPANRGDVVLFNINTIHGSYINQTDKMRRMVRVGYRDPANHQVCGQSYNRPGLIVSGRRQWGCMPGDVKDVEDINHVNEHISGAGLIKV